MKTYITIIALIIITFYLYFYHIGGDSPIQKPIVPQQENIVDEKKEASQSKKEFQNEIVDYSQQKTTSQHDFQPKDFQKPNQKNNSQSTSQQKNTSQEVIQKTLTDIKKSNSSDPKIAEDTISISETLIRSEFLHLINTTRTTPVILYNSLLNSSNLRALEASKKWSHIRPNGTRWNTVLKNIIDISSIPHGENLAQTQIAYKENYTHSEIIQIVSTLHQGLINSPTHYAVMTNENYKKMNIGIYIEKKDTYLLITIAQHYIS